MLPTRLDNTGGTTFRHTGIRAHKLDTNNLDVHENWSGARVLPVALVLIWIVVCQKLNGVVVLRRGSLAHDRIACSIEVIVGIVVLLE